MKIIDTMEACLSRCSIPTFCCISKFSKILISGLLSITLLACTDPPLDNPNVDKFSTPDITDKFTTLDDDTDDPIEVDAAIWRSDMGVLSVLGDYNGDVSATIIIHDQQPPKTVFGTIQVNSYDDDWNIELDSLAYAPCSITAMFEDQSISDIMASVMVIGAPDDCGSGNTTPVPTPNNIAPVAVIMPDSNQIITSPATIDFMGDTSNDPDGNTPLSYSWRFPGGVPSTSIMANQVVTYETPGIYTAILVVTDSLGMDSVPASIMVTVNDPTPVPTPANNAPLAVMMPDTNQIITNPATIDFMGDTSSDPDANTPLTYLWTFPGGIPDMSTTPNQVVTYETPGSYTASLVVTDSLGMASEPVSIMVTVNAPTGPTPGNNAPVAVMMPNTDQSITTAFNMNSINFIGSNSSDPDNNTPLTYMWDFQGGTPATSTMADPVVAYNTAGSFPATLTVTDSLGMASASVSIMVTVITPAPPPPQAPPANIAPIAEMVPNTNQTIPAASTIDFMGDTSSDPDGNTPLTYSWQFQGGVPAMSTSPNQAVIYNSTGSFSATLTVTDSLGLASEPVSILVVVTPGNAAPTAVITPNTDQNINIGVAGGNTIDFVGLSSFDIDGNVPLTYMWNFQGGTPASSTLDSETVTYNNVGNYTATLTVTDNLGMPSAQASINVTVSNTTPVNQPPDGNIQSTPMADASGIINLDLSVSNTVNFSGIATDPDNDTMTYDWAIDGATPATSTMLSPGDVTYTTAGTYTTTFTVTDAAMNVDPTPATVTVVVTDPAPAPLAGTTISMIVLNDLHAHLTLHDDLKRNADGTTTLVKRGGLARIATEVNMIRMDNPNNILMNIGDTYHGGVEAFYSLGNAIVAPVELLGIDVGVPGNWDFAYGPNVTRARYTNSAMPTPITILGPDPTITTYLAANVTDSLSTLSPPTLLPETWSKTIMGVTVGIIGITSDIVPSMHPNLAAGMTFEQGEANYITLIERLANNLRMQTPPADVVLVMSELGIHKDRRLADAIAMGTVDVFFSAHTHELTTTPLTSTSGALIVEAGNDTYLGRMDITASTTGNSFNWRVIPIDATVVEDQTMLAAVNNARMAYLGTGVNLSYPQPLISGQSLSMSIDTVLATTSSLLSRRNSLESSFNNLMADMLKNANMTNLAVTPGFRFDTTIPGMGSLYEDQTVATGDITIEDVYRFFPVPYNLATAEITEANLRSNIETSLNKVYSTDSFVHSGGWFDGYAGLSLAVSLSNMDGNRITGMTYQDGAVNTNLITIAGCTRPFEQNSTTFCTNSTNFSNIVTLTDATGAPLSAINFFISQLQAGTNSGFPARQDITDTSNTPLWPVSEYIQPIN